MLASMTEGPRRVRRT